MVEGVTVWAVARPASESFLAVGVVVALTMLVVEWGRNHASGSRFHGALLGRWAPVAGAFAGVVPGCAGALVVVTLYLRGRADGGAVVAALVATAGDSAFVVLALTPAAAMAAYGISAVTGVASGVAVARVNGIPTLDDRPVLTDGGETVTAPRPLARWTGVLWWATVAAGAVVFVLELARIPVPDAVGVGVGLSGLVVSGMLILLRRGQPACGGTTAVATRTATVVSQVAVVFVGLALASKVQLPVAPLSTVAASGPVAAVGGAVLGLIPGCGVQTALAGLYVQGTVPFAALVANAMSQDGDALLPLLTQRPWLAARLSAYTLVPALLVGVGVAVVCG